jgi:hypothetical protein
MEKFEITQRVDGRLITCVMDAIDEEDAQDRMICNFEDRGWVHGEIINIEAI